MAPQSTPERGTVQLCGVFGCCPTVDFTDPKVVVLKDDFNGKVQFTPEQWQDLKNKFAPKPN